MKAWINGHLIDEEKALVSIFDRSYLYGEGVFEALMCYEGKPAFFSRHVARLKKNCAALQLNLSYSEKELAEGARKLLEANAFKTGALRWTFSHIGAAFGVVPPKNPPTNFTMFCRTIQIEPSLFENGVKILPLQEIHNDSSQTAGIKSTSYIIKMMARAKAGAAGAYESILKNEKGYWVEGSRTNLFTVHKGMVVTAPLKDGLLPGVTRDIVIEIIQKLDLPFREDHLTDASLKEAEEIFLTGSTSEVMPVCEVIGMAKKKVAAASITKRLQKEYRQAIA